MTGAEFAEIRKGLPLTQEHLAEWLGVGRRTVLEIEKAEGEIPKLYELAIERVSLAMAATSKNHKLAAPSVRRDAEFIGVEKGKRLVEIRAIIDEALKREGL